MVILGENVINDLLMSQNFGYYDIFSYKFLIKVLYNYPDQFYIFLLFAVPKISILLKISGFYMFSKIKYFFVFHIERKPALAISFFLIN